MQGKNEFLEVPLRSIDKLLDQEVLSVIKSAPKLDVARYLRGRYSHGRLPPHSKFIDTFVLPVHFGLN